MKIILKGLNGEFVNFDNVFKISVLNPELSKEPYKVMAHSGSDAGGYNDNECILFKGTEEEVNQWQDKFQRKIRNTWSEDEGSVRILDCPNL